MSRLICLLLLLFVASPALSESRALRNVRIALNWKAEPQFGGFYAALGSPFLHRGLDVTLLPGGSGTPTVQMLANGQVDAAIVSAEEILISNERNPKRKVVAIFAVFQTNPQMIMCRQTKNFESLEQVFASTVTLAMQSGLTYAQFLNNKYPKRQAKVVPYAGGITSFLAQENFCQQGFATSEPLSANKAGVPPRVFLVADEGFNPYTTVLAVRAEDLEKSSWLATQLARGSRLGWESYLAEPSKVNEQMQKLNPSMDLETFKLSAEAQKPLIMTDETRIHGPGWMSEERWSKLIAQLKDLKVLKTDLQAKDQFWLPPPSSNSDKPSSDKGAPAKRKRATSR